MDPAATVDEVLARLVDVVSGTGTRIRRPRRGVRATLDRIAAEVTPLEIPAELVTFWRSIDPRCLAMAPSPRPVSPEFGLECWRALRSGAGVPRVLFPVCYEDGEYLFVELAGNGHPGGRCFRWAAGGRAFELTFECLTGYLDLLAGVIRAGTGVGGRRDAVPQQDGEPFRLVLTLPSPVRPGATIVDSDHWPPHWRAVEGLDGGGGRPRGTVATVSRLLDEAEILGSAAGVLRIRVLRTTTSALGRRVTVADPSGELEVWCPTALVAPVVGREYEVEVLLPAEHRPRMDAVDGPVSLPIEVTVHLEPAHPPWSGTDAGSGPDPVTEVVRKRFGTPVRARVLAIRPL
jgi:hypothetical protein